MALPIAAQADIAAALNLYATRPSPWSDSAQAMGKDPALYTGNAITLANRHSRPDAPPLGARSYLNPGNGSLSW